MYMPICTATFLHLVNNMDVNKTNPLDVYWDNLLTTSSKFPKETPPPKCSIHKLCRTEICAVCLSQVSNRSDHNCQFPGNYIFDYDSLDVENEVPYIGDGMKSSNYSPLVRGPIFRGPDGIRSSCKHQYGSQAVMHFHECEVKRLLSDERDVSPLFMPVKDRLNTSIPYFVNSKVFIFDRI